MMTGFIRQVIKRHVAGALLALASCLWLGSGPLLALELTADPNSRTALLPHMQLVEPLDQEASITIDALLQRPDAFSYQPLNNSELRFNGRPGSHWFRFQLKNGSSETLPLWLEIDNHRINRATLYAVDENRGNLLLSTQTVGDHQRDIRFEQQGRMNLLALKLPPGQAQTYFLQVQHNTRIVFLPSIYTEHTKTLHVSTQNQLLGLFYGVMLALFIYNLKVYLSLKDPLFFYFIGFLTVIFLYTASIQGNFKSLFNYQGVLIDGTEILVSLLYITAHVLFVRKFLSDQSRPRYQDHILLVLALAPLFIAPAVLWLQPGMIRVAILFMTSICSAAIIYFAAVHFGKGYRPSGLILIGASAFVVPLAVTFLGKNTSFRLLSNENWYNGVIVFQLLIYSCGLVAKIDQLNRQLRREVHNRERRERRLVQAQSIARYGDWEWDIKSRNISFSESALLILPPAFTTSTMDLKEFFHLIGKDEKPALIAKIRHAITGKTNFNHELKLMSDEGEHFYLVRADFLPGQESDIFVGTIHDITESKITEMQLEKMGYYDSLTGLANRVLFNQRLQHAINKAKRAPQNHAILFIDLDQFKTINDSLGHDIGDQLLIHVADCLREQTRLADTVARLGGDEFAILIEDIPNPNAAAKVAQHIIRSLSEKAVDIDSYNLMVTPSIGIAMFPDTADTASELIRKADTAMYFAKNQGRNNYQFYTEQLNTAITRRMELESELRLALSRGELSVCYQPKVDLATGMIIGAEALLRWHSQKHGNIPPSEFIPVAEETGLIWKIGEYVLNTACQQAKQWLDTCPDFHSMAVNISGVQFSHRGLIASVKNALLDSALCAENLELEITENVIIDNAEEAMSQMNELKNIGIRLSLDDFGTGYSSLKYLKRFPVNSLKIDRSFVSEIVYDQTDRRIAANIIKLAHGLNLTVVAEGVETTEQLAIIRNMGCDQLQGYIFSKAVTANEFTALLMTKQQLFKHAPAEHCDQMDLLQLHQG